MIARALSSPPPCSQLAPHTLAQTRNSRPTSSQHPRCAPTCSVADLVRIGDIVDNAGSAGQIAIYRAPDLGTTGSLPVAQVLNTLRATT